MPFDPLATARATSTGSGDFVKFPTLGSWVRLTVTNARPFPKDGVEYTTLDGTDDQGNPMTMPLDTGSKSSAFIDAVSKVGWVQLVFPFRITMQWYDERPSDKGNPTKLYRASIEPLTAGPKVADLPMPGNGAPAGPPPAPPAPQGPPPGLFPPTAGQPGGPPAFAGQPPQAAGGPPPGQPWAQVDGQWVAPSDPRYPQQGPPASPPAQANEVAQLFQ